LETRVANPGWQLVPTSSPIVCCGLYFKVHAGKKRMLTFCLHEPPVANILHIFNSFKAKHIVSPRNHAKHWPDVRIPSFAHALKELAHSLYRLVRYRLCSQIGYKLRRYYYMIENHIFPNPTVEHLKWMLCIFVRQQ